MQEAKGADVVVVVTPSTEDRGDIAAVAVKAAAGAGVDNIIVISVPISDAATHLFVRQFRPLEEVNGRLAPPPSSCACRSSPTTTGSTPAPSRQWASSSRQ